MMELALATKRLDSVKTIMKFYFDHFNGKALLSYSNMQSYLNCNNKISNYKSSSTVLRLSKPVSNCDRYSEQKLAKLRNFCTTRNPTVEEFIFNIKSILKFL